MAEFKTLTSRTVVLPAANVDTDQICPARFLKITTREGLGKALFADWRYDREGRTVPDFALNRLEAEGAQVLVAGENFGCGSSREHAPWALHDYGFRAVVSSSIADIFMQNALKNGLLPVVVEPKFHEKLLARPGAVVTINLEASTLTFDSGEATSFSIDPFARYCLLRGTDELGFLVAQAPAIAAFEAKTDR